MHSKKCFSILLSLMLLWVFAFSAPCNIYAFDDKYTNVDDLVNWSGIKSGYNINDDNVTLQAKWIADTNDACFYMFIYYSEKSNSSEKTDEDDKVTLKFNVKNEKSNYEFTVDDNNSTNSQIKNKIDIYKDFSKVNATSDYNELLVAFQFKNANDKSLTNYISCDFSFNNDDTYNLFNEYEMDMYVPQQTTTKQTTTKITTQKTTTQKSTKQTTTKLTTQKTTKVTTAKESKIVESSPTAKEKSTKFVPSNPVTRTTKNSKYKKSSSATKFSYKRKSKKSGSTKYTPKAYNGSTVKQTKFEPTANQNESIDSTDDVATQNSLSKQYDLTGRTLKQSDKSKYLTVFAIVLLSVGILFVIIGTVSGKYKIVKAENDENDGEGEDDAKDKNNDNNN